MESYFEENERVMSLRLRNVLDELPEICSAFFISVKSTLSARTRLNYAYDLRIFFRYIEDEAMNIGEKGITDDDIRKIDSYMIDGYIDYLTRYMKNKNGETAVAVKNGERGKARKLSTLNKFFGFLVKRGIIEKSPMDVIDMPKIHEKEIVVLDANEVSRLIDCVGTGDGLTKSQKKYYRYTRLRDIAIVMLILGTGMRISECVGIDIKDISFKDRSIKIIRKGGNEARVFFGQEVEKALLDYKNERENMKPDDESKDAFFLSLKNKRITTRAVQLLVKKYSQIITDKKISPHKLRSTFATSLYGDTHDIYLVAECLGHKSVDTTRKHYAKMEDQRRRQAVNEFKINREN